MLEGVLRAQDHHLFLCVDGSTPPPPVLIEQGRRLEINLGTHWIEGVFRPDFDETGAQIEPYDLICGASFCGLRSGMRARLCNEAMEK